MVDKGTINCITSNSFFSYLHMNKKRLKNFLIHYKQFINDTKLKIVFHLKGNPTPRQVLRLFDTNLYPSKLLLGPECVGLIQVSQIEIISRLHCILKIRASNLLKFKGFPIDLILWAIKAVKVFLKPLLKKRFLISQDSKYCSFRVREESMSNSPTLFHKRTNLLSKVEFK